MTTHRWILRIEEASPSLNEFTYSHWRKQALAKRHWFLRIRCTETFDDVPPASGKRRLTIERHGRRTLDKDNLLGGAKCVITDNLRRLRLLVDDTDEFLELEGRNEKLRPHEPRPYTLLILEEVA